MIQSLETWWISVANILHNKVRTANEPGRNLWSFRLASRSSYPRPALCQRNPPSIQTPATYSPCRHGLGTWWISVATITPSEVPTAHGPGRNLWSFRLALRSSYPRPALCQRNPPSIQTPATYRVIGLPVVFCHWHFPHEYSFYIKTFVQAKEILVWKCPYRDTTGKLAVLMHPIPSQNLGRPELSFRYCIHMFNPPLFLFWVCVCLCVCVNEAGVWRGLGSIIMLSSMCVVVGFV